MGFDSSSVMNPRRSSPSTMQNNPETMAIRLAVAMARAGSPAEAVMTTARIGAANAESGPSTRIRLGPNSA
ncbi:hypothetical protein D3C85_1580410 [compost metagenome]